MQSDKPPPVMPLSVSGCIVGNVVFCFLFKKREKKKAVTFVFLQSLTSKLLFQSLVPALPTVQLKH